MDVRKQEALRALGEAIRKARLCKGLSEDRLASWLDTSPDTIIDLECGRLKPEPPFLLRLAIALNVSPKEMFMQYAEHDPGAAKLVQNSDLLCHLFGAALDQARK